MDVNEAYQVPVKDMNRSSILEDQNNPQLNNQVAEALDMSVNANHGIMDVGGTHNQ